VKACYVVDGSLRQGCPPWAGMLILGFLLKQNNIEEIIIKENE
jgi:hypothetical protein